MKSPFGSARPRFPSVLDASSGAYRTAEATGRFLLPQEAFQFGSPLDGSGSFEQSACRLVEPRT